MSDPSCAFCPRPIHGRLYFYRVDGVDQPGHRNCKPASAGVASRGHVSQDVTRYPVGTRVLVTRRRKTSTLYGTDFPGTVVPGSASFKVRVLIDGEDTSRLWMPETVRLIPASPPRAVREFPGNPRMRL